MYLYRGECLNITASLTVQYFNETQLFRVAYYEQKNIIILLHTTQLAALLKFYGSMDSIFMHTLCWLGHVSKWKIPSSYNGWLYTTPSRLSGDALVMCKL